MLVRDLMEEAVVSIAPEESAALAARLMARHNVGVLPVCGRGGQLRGILTDRDIILRCIAPGEDPSALPVSRMMTRTPDVISPGDDLREAAQKMSALQVRRLPVADLGRLVGMLSLGDLARSGQAQMEVSRALTDISDNIRRP